MKVTLINHSSLLFELNKGKNVFLTDFLTSKSLLKLFQALRLFTIQYI